MLIDIFYILFGSLLHEPTFNLCVNSSQQTDKICLKQKHIIRKPKLNQVSDSNFQTLLLQSSKSLPYFSSSSTSFSNLYNCILLWKVLTFYRLTFSATFQEINSIRKFPLALKFGRVLLVLEKPRNIFASFTAVRTFLMMIIN